MDGILRRLMAIEGVNGALLVGKDGLVTASTIDGEDEELLGAMAAASYDATCRYIEQLGMGEVRHAIFETLGGTIQVTDGGELLIVVRSMNSAHLGRIRIEAEHAGQRLAEQIGSY
ncbi:MAG: roadblock/LC7 domain-containing protein [Ktedonobacterales bacterium]|nr:roadblock/LC7 domain-containing protein [Ktedonobacterales bacterium]